MVANNRTKIEPISANRDFQKLFRMCSNFAIITRFHMEFGLKLASFLKFVILS